MKRWWRLWAALLVVLFVGAHVKYFALKVDLPMFWFWAVLLSVAVLWIYGLLARHSTNG